MRAYASTGIGAIALVVCSACGAPATSPPKAAPLQAVERDVHSYARPEEARALFERVSSHAELAIFDDADHMQLERRDPLRYWQLIERLLGDSLATR